MEEVEDFYEDFGQNETILEQVRVEDEISQYLDDDDDDDAKVLRRDLHVEYIERCLEGLPDYFVSLDASQTWLCYWSLHSLDLLNYPELHVEKWRRLQERTIKTLKRCQHPDGGFGGGAGHLAHLAPTYSAILSLAIVATPEAYDLIDRSKLYAWLMRMKQPDGSFTMHEGGEIDVR